jgi:hypothetical protein
MPDKKTLQESKPLGDVHLPYYVSDWKNQGIDQHLLEEKMRIEWLLAPFGA